MSLKNKESVIIVGGGIAGLFSAMLLSKTHSDVTLIERADSPGGLMKSVSFIGPDNKNYDFDYGTHFVLLSGDPSTDQMIEEGINKDEWIRFEQSLLEGHAFGFEYYEDSGCVNARALDKEKFELGLRDLKKQAAVQTKEHDNKTLKDALIFRYGQTYAHEIYEPIFKKLTGQASDELSAKMETAFFPPRVIVADRKESIEYKKTPALDERIAFSYCRDYESKQIKYYPKQGGIGKWINNIVDQLKDSGVKIINNTEINSIDCNDEIIKNVTLSSGHELKCSQLVWTAPPIFLAKMTKLDVPSYKPDFCEVVLWHFLSDKAPLTKVHWSNNYETSSKHFRATYYDNIQTDNEDAYSRITVELMGPQKSGLNDVDAKSIFEELIEIGALPKDAKMAMCQKDYLPAAFPLINEIGLDAWRKQTQILEDTFKNLVFIGRHPDKGSTQVPIIQQALNAFG